MRKELGCLLKIVQIQAQEQQLQLKEKEYREQQLQTEKQSSDCTCELDPSYVKAYARSGLFEEEGNTTEAEEAALTTAAPQVEALGRIVSLEAESGGEEEAALTTAAPQVEALGRIVNLEPLEAKSGVEEEDCPLGYLKVCATRAPPAVPVWNHPLFPAGAYQGIEARIGEGQEVEAKGSQEKSSKAVRFPTD